MGYGQFYGVVWFVILLLFESSMAAFQRIGKLEPGVKWAQMNWVDNSGGLFLISNQSIFGLGFTSTSTDVTLFLLVVMHISSRRVIWAPNRDFPVANSDNFVFDNEGNAYLQKAGATVWTTNTAGIGVSSMELQDSGNLVLWGNDSRVIWQSFGHPTDTLISNQNFVEGMQLVSARNANNSSFVLKIRSGDMFLSAGYSPPQPYWSIKNDVRKIINKNGGQVVSASLSANSWGFYDKDKTLLWQFKYSDDTSNTTWIAVLGNDGFMSFYNLEQDSASSSPTKIPSDPCSTPEPCGPYYICSGSNRCQCPTRLTSHNCGSGISSPCGSGKNSVSLVDPGDGLGYFALSYISPSSKTDLNGCKDSCMTNCSCLAMFFENRSGNCFLLGQIGSFQTSSTSSDFVSFVKVSGNGGTGGSTGTDGSSKKSFPYVAIIVVVTVLVIGLILFVAFRYFRTKKSPPGSPDENSEEDNFLGTMSMPTRFSYKELQKATNDFSVRLGQGGFGSVYKGVLLDGTEIAVKKLEGIGQGKKEFRAEVSIIGSIHHHHLVKLKGFCAEGSHRLLAYEYMANGSLDKWIFRRNNIDFLLDWETRFGIALGTAKGLAYLHEDCDQKIIHCDIKPENVLLDERFLSKVSDFGLAKLMTREQSHVFTTLRGTRGYLAPEWITNYAISEKSDVYSYGMLLLEIIGGRKNYDPTETSEKSHYPSFAFKMMEEGKLREILDSRLQIDEDDLRILTAVKVALWCIQEDMHLRPSMTRVVQMLEGLCTVPKPPTCSTLGSRLFASFVNSGSRGGTSSGPSECNGDDYMSAVRLSGPR